MTVGSGLPSMLLMLDARSSRPVAEPRRLTTFDSSLNANLAGQFVKRARQQPQTVAITTASEHWSYGDLLTAASEVAKSLRANPQFSRGSRVILLLPNSFEYVAAFYGTLLADAVVVPLPPGIESQVLRRVCSSTEAIAAIVPAESKKLSPVLSDLPSTRVLLANRDTENERDLTPIGHSSDLAAIFFTAGSTGDPKGVMLSHRNLIENASSIQQYLEISTSDRPLCVLPFYHAFGNSVLQSHLLAGATLILDGKPLFPETLIAAISRHAATSLSAVPDLVRVLHERTSLTRAELPSLRYLAVAGGSLHQELAVTLAKQIAPKRLFLMYGQTEATARLAYIPPDQLADLPASCIGQAIPGVELEVVNESGLRVSTGEIGELRARGPNVMLGYWRDVDGTAARLRDGWLSTGDLATTDDKGWIYHRGRLNAIVKIAGYRVHPADLEEFALRRLSVRQAVAVAFEAPQVGTRLALYISQSLANDLTPPEMLARCRAELPRHLVPNFIQRVDDFPLNAAFKVDRLLLSQRAEQDAVGKHPGLNLDQAVAS